MWINYHLSIFNNFFCQTDAINLCAITSGELEQCGVPWPNICVLIQNESIGISCLIHMLCRMVEFWDFLIIWNIINKNKHPDAQHIQVVKLLHRSFSKAIISNVIRSLLPGITHNTLSYLVFSLIYTFDCTSSLLNPLVT